MELKKNPKIDLKKNRSLYFLFGLSFILFLVWMLFEIKIYEKDELIVEDVTLISEYENEIPIPTVIIPLPPPPAIPAEVIQIVDDEIEIIETIISSTETDQEEIIAEYNIVSVDEIQISEPIEEDIRVPFAIIEDVPIFPGCEGISKEQMRTCFMQKTQLHIRKNFSYPKDAVNQNIQGKVYVSFIIDQKGNITNIESRAPHFILKESAESLIKSLPKMTPGKQRGKPVKVNYSIPIVFKII